MLEKLEIGKLYKLKPKHHWWWGLDTLTDVIPNTYEIISEKKGWSPSRGISIEDNILLLLTYSKRLKVAKHEKIPAFLFMTASGKLCYLIDSTIPSSTLMDFKKNWVQL